jgi:hypothetical protein
MNHMDEGTIAAIRDGALSSTDARLHLDACATCREALASATARAARIVDDLASLDCRIDVEAAKEQLRERIDSARGAAVPWRGQPWYIGRAAALLLLTAGAAYAFPGSPLRDWISGESAAAGGQAELGDPLAQEAPESVGIGVDVPDGRIRITVRGMLPESELEVVWLDAPTAQISAAPGSTYSFAEGHAEATVTSGPVRIEVPRTASMISIEVNGRMVLQRSGGGLALPGRVLEQDADRILFSIPEG